MAPVPVPEVEQPEPIETPSSRAAPVNASTPVETFPPQPAPDPYVRQQVSRCDFRTRAPDTDPYLAWYAAQRREAVGSSSSHRNVAARAMSPAAAPFVPSAAAVDSVIDEVAYVRRFLEDAGVLRSDEPAMSRTEMLYFVKGRMR